MKTVLPLSVVALLGVIGVGLVISKPKNSPTETKTNELSQNNSPTATSAPTIVPTSVQNNLPLSISTPADGVTVTSSTITVKGKTGAKAEVAVNDAETTADANGNFSVQVTLDEGENFLYIVVNDADGNVTEKELTIIYDSGE